jgi:pimeloyl-ACP methyl ester carboxylesterase
MPGVKGYSATMTDTLLASGAQMRVTGTGPDAVVCVNGGGRAEVPGTWSAALEWIVRELAPAFPALRFAEVRYRIKSWRRIDLCVEDAQAAVQAVAAERTLLLGYSMGGAVAVSVAGLPGVTGVVGLAPWIPQQLDLSALRGRTFVVLHGSLDRPLLGVPGVTPSSSRRAVDRARAVGAECSYTLVRGGLHGIALRTRTGRLLSLPRAGRWAELVAHELERFRAVVE